MRDDPIGKPQIAVKLALLPDPPSLFVTAHAEKPKLYPPEQRKNQPHVGPPSSGWPSPTHVPLQHWQSESQ